MMSGVYCGESWSTRLFWPRRLVMSGAHLWLTEAQFARLQPLLPNKPRGVPRVDDRRVISGILHVLRNGLMWRDCPGLLWSVQDALQSLCALERGRCVRPVVHGAGRRAGRERLGYARRTHITAHRTAASLQKKGYFPARLAAPAAASPPSSTPFVTERGDR